MSLILAACCCVLAQTEVTVRPLSGEPLRGGLLELSQDHVSVQTASGARRFEANELAEVKFAPPQVTPAGQVPGVWVELIDDSTFPGASFVATQEKASVRGMAGEEISLPVRFLRAVRFQPQDNAVRKQWLSIAAGTREGDVLVVRKVTQAGSGSTAPAEIVLDQLTGIVHDVRDNIVDFEFDGKRLDVARARLEGIVFRQQPEERLPELVGHVITVDGGSWTAKSIELRGNRLDLVSVGGARVEVPLSRISEIDFSAANLVYLSDIEPESMEWRPYLQSSATPASLKKWFEPKGASLILDGESYEKGLSLHSWTRMTYRLTRNFRRFSARIGIDERFRGTANLSLVVSGDGRPLLTRAIMGDDPPWDIELDIDGVRRLGILVDFGDDHSDAGDLLYLCNARLVK